MIFAGESVGRVESRLPREEKQKADSMMTMAKRMGFNNEYRHISRTACAGPKSYDEQVESANIGNGFSHIGPD